MSAISDDWARSLAPEFKKEYYRKLYEFVLKEYTENVVYQPSFNYAYELFKLVNYKSKHYLLMMNKV
jgi:uracil-DNA glycosylase